MAHTCACVDVPGSYLYNNYTNRAKPTIEYIARSASISDSTNRQLVRILNAHINSRVLHMFGRSATRYEVCLENVGWMMLACLL